MLKPRENTLATIYGEKADYVPLSSTAFQLSGFLCADIYAQPSKSGPDAFGVPWAVKCTLCQGQFKFLQS